jgi:hypothetical protein
MNVMGSDFDGGDLEFEEFIAEILWDSELDEAFARFLAEMVCHFYVYVVRRNGNVAGPTLLDHFDKVFGNIDAPAIVPAVVKPGGEFGAGVVVGDIDI